MALKVKTLNDPNTGDQIAPRTLVEAIVDRDGVNLSSTLEGLDTNKASNADLDVMNKRISNLVANTGEQTEGNAELIDIRVGADGTQYETAGDAVREQIINTHEIIEYLTPERTHQLLDWKNVPILNAYIDTSSKNLVSNKGCRFISIDVSGNTGKQIFIHKPTQSRFTLATFTSPSPEIGENYIRCWHVSNSLSAAITLEDGENSVGIWYFYDSEDESVQPDEVLKSMMINYGTFNRYEPYKAMHGFKEISTHINWPSPNFRDKMYVSNSKCFISVPLNGSVKLEDAPNEDTWGHYVLVNEIFYNNGSTINVLQRAYTRSSESVTGSTPREFYRYLIVKDGEFDVSNEGIYRWKDINELVIPNEFIKTNMLSSENTVYAPFDLSQYSIENHANNQLWFTDFVYPRGYVKSIQLLINETSEQDITILFVKKLDGCVFKKINSKGYGNVTLEIEEYISLEYYIGICAENSAFKAGSHSTLGYSFKAFSADKASDVKEGETIDLSFIEQDDSGTSYVLAQEVHYSSIKESLSYSEKKMVTRNRLFAAGDSITAGHPSYIEGEHWWETVGRTLNYKVSVGARSGSGMSYWKGTNACKIANNTDFSQYNVAVFAFGTNDYGNNIPIGTINDEYTYSEDSSQTFYSAIKHVISTVMNSNPSIALIFALPINRCDKGTQETNWAFGTENSLGFTLSDYCDAIIAVCDLYGIPYIDRRHSVFNAYTIPTLLCDALHPSVEGYKILGQEMSAKIGAIILPYTEYDGIGGIGKW